MPDTQLQFLGGTDTVTGSKFLLRIGAQKVLIDCGMFQGLDEIAQRNHQDPGIDPASVDAVVLTHGHLDHAGYLPRFHKLGFRGPVYGTAPTLDVARIIVKDSANIQEWEAEKQNRDVTDPDRLVEPLYNTEDAFAVIDRFERCAVNTWHQISEDISYRHRRAGHILGATFLEMNVAGRHITFSGDLGRSEDPLMSPPEPPRDTDHLILESTYGNRCHVRHRTTDLLETYIRETIQQKGSVLIPSFAVERSQHVMWLLHTLKKQDRIPDVPMYLDTPMGIDVSGLFYEHPEWHKLTIKQWRNAFDQFIPVENTGYTKKIVDRRKPKIVIAGSGMVTGGRILTYLEKHLTDPDSTLLLVGYQAEETRGRALKEGADHIRFHGTPVPVHIRVETIAGLSAHADQRELMDWVSRMDSLPEQIYLVHGDPPSRSAFQKALSEETGNEPVLPGYRETVSLS